MEPILAAGAVLLSSWIVSNTVNQDLLECNRNKSGKPAPNSSLFTKFWEYLSSPPSEFDRKGEALLVDRVEALNGKLRDAIHGQALRCYRAFILIHLTERQFHLKLQGLKQQEISFNSKDEDIVRAIEDTFGNSQNIPLLDPLQLTDEALANPSGIYITSLPEWKPRLSFEDMHQLVKKAFEDLERCQDDIIASSTSELVPLMPLKSRFRKSSIAINEESTPKDCLSQLIQQAPQQTRNIQELLTATDRLRKTCKDEFIPELISRAFQNAATSVLESQLRKSAVSEIGNRLRTSTANNTQQIVRKIQLTLIEQIRLCYQLFIEHHLAQPSSQRVKIEVELNNMNFQVIDRLATQAYQDCLASTEKISLGCLSQLGHSKEYLEKKYGQVIILDVNTILSSKMCLAEFIQEAPDQTKNIQRLMNFFKVLSSQQIAHQNPGIQNVNIISCKEIQNFVNRKISSIMHV